MGTPGGVGVTHLTPQDVTKGERRWRTGTYREGGGGAEADLLHGAEEQAAGSHAPPAPRPGLCAGDPNARLGPASLPGGAGRCRSGSRTRLSSSLPPSLLHPSLHPSSFPSFPPSSASTAPGSPASRRRSRDRGPSEGPAARLVTVISGGLAGEEQLCHTTHPQTKGMSILLPPRSCTPRRGTWDPLPCPGRHRLPPHPSPGAKGGVGPPACNFFPRREHQNSKGVWMTPGATRQQEPPTRPHSQSVQYSVGKLRRRAPQAGQATGSMWGPSMCARVSPNTCPQCCHGLWDSTVTLCPVCRMARARGPVPGRC